MNVYKFLNQSYNKRITILSILNGILILSMLLFDNLIVSVFCLLFIIIIVINIFKETKKLSQTIEELQIYSDTYKFYFFSNKRKSCEVERKSIIVEVDDIKVVFRNKTNELIGISYKNMIEHELEWESFISTFENVD